MVRFLEKGSKIKVTIMFRGREQSPRRRFVDEFCSIDQRPAEANDRAVPGHWEGDLILGKCPGLENQTSCSHFLAFADAPQSTRELRIEAWVFARS